MKIIYFENKKMNLLKNEQQEWQKNGKICYICKKILKIKMLKIENIVKFIIQVNTEVLLIAYVIWSIIFLKKLS